VNFLPSFALSAIVKDHGSLLLSRLVVLLMDNCKAQMGDDVQKFLPIIT
jgi:hypothetical protein